MAWFVYSDQKRRQCRKGIWLRVRALPDDLLKTIKSKMKKSESIAWVKVEEIRPKNKVLLEIWCFQKPSAFSIYYYPFVSHDRFTVFHILVDENPDWVCESDLGRGLV